MLSAQNHTLLERVATFGKIVCDTFELRVLWYKGMLRWCSPTEVELTVDGLNALYRHEEKNNG